MCAAASGRRRRIAVPWAWGPEEAPPRLGRRGGAIAGISACWGWLRANSNAVQNSFVCPRCSCTFYVAVHRFASMVREREYTAPTRPKKTDPSAVSRVVPASPFGINPSICPLPTFIVADIHSYGWSNGDTPRRGMSPFDHPLTQTPQPSHLGQNVLKSLWPQRHSY